MAFPRPTALALVALGGFCGSIARYGVSLAAPGPAGTFAVNVTGSFLLGYVFFTALTTDRPPRRARLLVAPVLLSSYTTYSTFALQTVALPLSWGLLNVLANYLWGFVGAVLGRRLATGGWR